MANVKRYAYRILVSSSPKTMGERLNEAWSRGWKLHTFTDATEGFDASVVFETRDQTKSEPTPFANDKD